MRLAFVLAIAACGPKPTGDGDGSESGSGGEASGTGTGTASGTATVDPTSGEVGETTTGPGPGVCPDPNSHLEGDDCFCNEGFAWCEPGDPENLSCCAIGGTTTAPTTVEPTSTSTSPTGMTSGDDDATAGTTGEPLGCAVLPPDGCGPGGETRYCDSGPDCPLEGSTLYACVDGQWVPGDADASCKGTGHDFAFGCLSDGDTIEVVCGDGPGTACEADQPGFCIDVAVLQACQHGKLADTDCVKACMAGEIDGMVHDGGFCMMTRQSSTCECCDAGECP